MVQMEVRYFLKGVFLDILIVTSLIKFTYPNAKNYSLVRRIKTLYKSPVD